MRNKTILVSFVALFAMILTLTVVSADCSSCTSSSSSDCCTYSCDNFVSIDHVYVNGVDADFNGGTTYVGEVSNTIPVEVQFTALEDVSDRVKVKVSIEGYKDDIEQYVTMNTPLAQDVSGYVGRLSLKLPSTMDLSQPCDTDQCSISGEDTVMHIQIYTKECTYEKDVRIKVQRDLYSLNILSVDATDSATAGSTVDLDVVLQNNGNQRLDNVYVKASIPELGVSRDVYFGDLKPNAESTYEDIRDTTERHVFLTLPRNAAPGTYKIQVEASNYDVSATATKSIEVSSLGSGVLPTSNANTIAVGQDSTFDLVLVNPNDKMIVYSITPETAKGLSVSVDQPVVAVSAGTSKTVQVKVHANSDADTGTHLVTVDVNSDSGLVKQVSYSVTVQNATTSSGSTSNPSTGLVTSNGVLILTVVLVIIFVVLLIVLIVLLTRRPAETEEFGETSYY